MNIREQVAKVLWEFDCDKELGSANRAIDQIIPLVRADMQREIAEWLNSWWDMGRMGKQDWYKLQAFITSLDSGTFKGGNR